MQPMKAQKLGRAPLAVLALTSPPLGPVLTGARIMFPTEANRLSAALFSDQNPIVPELSSAIVTIDGARFQQWSARPSSIDFFEPPR
jgi:hypothetical protein